MNRDQQCAQCRQTFKPILKPNSLIHRAGATLRPQCPACTAKNEAAWRARKATT